MGIDFKAENILTDIIESFLPRFSPDNIVLTFGLKLHWSYYKGGREHIYTKRILLAIHRPSNYTKVLTYVLKEDEIFSNLLSKDSEIIFNLKSDHDSCWRSDGFSFLFKSWCEAEEYFNEKFKVDIRDDNIVSTYHTLDLFGGKPKFFNVAIDKVRDENYKENGYVSSYKILFLNEVKTKFEV